MRKGGSPVAVHNETLPDIKRRTAFFIRVIPWNIALRAATGEDVGCACGTLSFIYCVGPGVSDVAGQAVRQTLVDLNGKSVVPAVQVSADHIDSGVTGIDAILADVNRRGVSANL